MKRFSIEKYSQTKRLVVQHIKKTHDWKHTEGFIADGVVKPALYSRQWPKILVILGETYGQDEEECIDIQTQPKDDFMGLRNPWVQSPRKICTLIWLLQKELEVGRKVPFESLPNLFKLDDQNYRELQRVLAKIAWVNVKKASHRVDNWHVGVTRQNYESIYDNAVRNMEVLRLQIESIAPDLIIACSDPVIDSLIEMKLLGDQIDKRKGTLQRNSYGQAVIFLTHPSYYRNWGYEGIYSIYTELRKSLRRSANKGKRPA